VINKNIEQRSAEALVATFVQMSRSAELARALQQLRQRSLESRVRQTSDARELVKLQVRLDAQQSQAAVLEAATNRFRSQAPNLAQFAKAGLTMEDFQRLGTAHVIEPERLATEIEKVKLGVSVPVPPSTRKAKKRRRPKKRTHAAAPAKPATAKPATSRPATAGRAAARPLPTKAATGKPAAAKPAPKKRHRAHPTAKHPPRKGPSGRRGKGR
jgi:hypothetical protein